MPRKDRDIIDDAMAKGTSIAELKQEFGEMSHADRSRILIALRHDIEMPESERERRARYVNALVVTHARINNVTYG
jgi:hypothetical protein